MSPELFGRMDSYIDGRRYGIAVVPWILHHSGIDIEFLCG